MNRRFLTLTLSLGLALTGLAALPSSDATAAPIARIVRLRPIPATPTSGKTETLTGVLSTSPVRSVVEIQEMRSHTWVTVHKTKIGTNGAFVYAFAVKPTGRRMFRAHAPATAELNAAYSTPFAINVVATPAKAFTTITTPEVSGRMRVGATLAVRDLGWKPRPSSFSYQWRRDGIAISNARSSKYTLTAADLTHFVTVEVSAKRSTSTTIRESATQVAVSNGAFAPGKPQITGSGAVGQTLVASPGGWTPEPLAYAYRWKRNGTEIVGANQSYYKLTAADAGDDITVGVTASRAGFAPATSTSGALHIAAIEPQPTPVDTFGSAFHPASTSVMPSSAVSATFSKTAPSWFSSSAQVRWDTAGAFTNSLEPQTFGTLVDAAYGPGHSYSGAAEYSSGNSTYKSVDVEFTLTGKRFAVSYLTYERSEAMVWINDAPVSASPFVHLDDSGGVVESYIAVDLPADTTIKVRFAGPLFFSGIAYDPSDPVTITASPAPFTLGIISDSFFEPIAGELDATRSAAVVLHTLTGFRIRDLAEGGSGYLNDATGHQLAGTYGYPGFKTKPYASQRNLKAIADPDIDALLVNGSVNDWEWTPAEQRAAVDNFLDQVAAVRPDLPVVLVGLEPLSIFSAPDEPIEPFTQMTANLASMAGRHDNVVGFIDPYTANWLTGTGWSTEHHGDGNQDLYVGSDGVHLNGAGQAYYQARIVDELAPLIAHVDN